MKYMEDLKEMLCKELEEIARKPEVGAGDLELIYKLTDSIKNIDKIYMLEEEGGYSQAGDWEMEGRGSCGRGSSYDGGNSYANRGQHYVRGHYSRDGGRGSSGRGGYSREGGYSRADGKERMMDHLDQMMQEAGSEKEREAIRRCMSQLENA